MNFKKISALISLVAVIPVVNLLKKAGDGLLYYEGIAIAEYIHSYYIKALPIGIAILLAGIILCRTKIGKAVVHCGVFVLFGALLSWTYMYNIMDAENHTFEAFQHDSEILLTKSLEREAEGFGLLEDDNGAYGLLRTDDNLGVVGQDNVGYPNSKEWKNGWCTTRSGIVLKNNEHTQKLAIVGAYMRNVHAPYTISEVQSDDEFLYIYFDSDIILTEEYEGSAHTAEFLRYLASYKSQYGLHGKIFRKHAEKTGSVKDAIVDVRFFNSTAMAMVVMTIVFLLYHKYDFMMAGCFYITFLLSQWVTNFGRNLYWVEFTWFIPMAVGIFCSLFAEKKSARILSYIGAFLSILLKCLCGYEYLSTIMMGLISFLLADILSAVIAKDSKKAMLLFRTTVIIGIFAIAGFVAAICMHANLRGNGNIAEGIQIIIQQDVMRRTHSTDPSMFSEDVQISLQSSVKDVVERYFTFETPVILGVESEKFNNLYRIAFVVGLIGVITKRRRPDDMMLYLVFLFGTVSWHVMAKAHSFVHTHMNYVLWYFGFVQICIYIIVSALPNLIIYHKKKDKTAAE